MMLFFVILWSVVRHFPKNEICYFSNPVLLNIERNSSIPLFLSLFCRKTQDFSRETTDY